MRSFVKSILIGMLFVIVISISSVTAEPAADWEQLGERLETSVTASAYMYEGSVYVAYRNEQAQVAVKTFNNDSGEWDYVGRNGGELSVYNGYDPVMYVHQGIPYVIFCDQQSGNRVLVKKYNDTTDEWENVGQAGFSDGTVGQMSLIASDSHTLYAAYMEDGGTEGYLPRIKKYSEETGSWQDAGDPSAFSSHSANGLRSRSNIILQANGGFVYLAYVQADSQVTNRTLTVWKLDESDPDAGWVELRGDSGTLPKIRGLYSFSMSVYMNIPYVTYENQLGSVVIMKFQDGEWLQVADPIEDIYRPLIAVENGVPYLSYFESDIHYENSGANHQLLVKKFDGDNWIQVGSTILPTRAGETLTNYGLQFDHGDLYMLYSEFWEPEWSFYANVKKIREDSLYLPSPILSTTGPNAPGSTAVITFEDDPAWRSAIESVRIESETLAPGVDYTIAAGSLVIQRPELLPPGKHAITVRAEGYTLTSAVQFVKPDAPEEVWIKAVGNRFVDLSWSTVDGAKEYTIYYGADADVAGGYEGQITVGAPYTNYLVTKLINDEIYYFAVTASADNVESAPSATISARPAVPTGADEWDPFGTDFNGFHPKIVADGNDLYIAYRDSPGGGAYVRKYDESIGWEVIGEGRISSLNGYDPSLAIDAGTPYISYGDQSAGNKLTVKKLDGGNWVPVGPAGFSAGAVLGATLVVDGGKPYVAYLEQGHPVIRVYTEETGWISVGDPSFLEGVTAGSMAMKLDEGNVYVAYIDTVERGSRVRLIKWEDAAGWQAMDTSAFPAAVSNGAVSLFLEAGIPYVAYPASSGIEVWKWNGPNAEWERMAAAAAGYTYAPSIHVDNGVPYVIYSAGPDTFYKLVVKKYINGAWYPVGDPVIPESGHAGGYDILIHEGNPLLVYYNGHQEVATRTYAYTWCEAQFQYGDERADTAQTFPCGQPIPRPDDPERANHIFGEWLLDEGAPYDFQEPVEADTALRALWKLPEPGNVRIIGREDGYVELGWDPVDEAAGYELYVGTEAGSYDAVPIAVSDTARRVEGLTNGVVYYFAVKAVNDEAESDYSVEVSENPVTKPGSPAIVMVDPGNREATVAFSVPEDNGGSPIDHYELTVYPGETIITGSGSPITVTGLLNKHNYRFDVVAVNAAGKKSGPSELSAPIMPFAMCSVLFNFKDDRLPVEEAVKCGDVAQQPEINERGGYTLEGWTDSASGEPFDLNNTVIEDDTALEANWRIDRVQLPSNQWNVLGVGGSPVTSSAMDVENGVLYTAEVENGLITVRKYTEADGWSGVGPLGFASTGNSPLKLKVDGGIPYVLFGDGDFPATLYVMEYNAADDGWITVGGREVLIGTPLSFDLHVDQGTPYVYAWYFDVEAGFTSKVLEYTGAGTGAWQEAAGSLTDNMPLETVIRMDGDRIYGALIETDYSIQMKLWDDAGEWMDIGGPGAVPGMAGEGLTFDLAVEGGRLYLAYISNEDVIHALLFSEESWHELGPVEVNGIPEQLIVDVYNEVPYLLYSYKLADNTKKTAVKRWDGGHWELVGDEWSTAGGRADQPGLHVDRGKPYAAYMNGNDEQVVLEFTRPLCNLTFDSRGGTEVPSQMVYCGEPVDARASAPEKMNYTFDGWYTSLELATAWDFERDAVTEDTVLVAKWNWNYADADLPIGLVAAGGDGQVTLTWDGAPDIVSYSVYVKPADGEYTDEAAITVSGETYEATVPGLDNGRAYVFKIGMTNIDGEAAVSEEVNAALKGVPGMPTAVMASAGDGRATVSFAAPADDGGSPILRYEVTSSPGAITVTGDESPIVIPGLNNGIVYTFTVKAINGVGAGEDSAVSNEVTPQAAKPDDGDDGTPVDEGPGDDTPIEQEPGGGGETDDGPDEEESVSVDVSINGQKDFNVSAVAMEVNGQRAIVVTIDPEGLQERLGQEGNGAKLTISVNEEADAVIGELNGRTVKAMAQQQAVLEVRTDNASYTIPAEQINMDAVRAQLGPDATLQDIQVRIGISAPSADELKRAAEAADRGEFTVVVPPLNFTIKGTYRNKTVEVSRFNSYVERRVALPASADPGRITTAVVIEPDGSLRHVPTRVEVIGDRYYAVIESLTNSLYSVIWNPVRFVDVTGHWAEEAVNDMGSRMVVNGVQGGLYRPDLNITRAELTAILVRGLGLAPVQGVSPFTDVSPGDWYYDAVNTAYSYGLVNGYGDGRFHPGAPITREQAMVMVANAMGMTSLAQLAAGGSLEQSLQSFIDAGDSSSWALQAIEDTIRAGIITGRTERLLAPKHFITRAEAAAIVRRLLIQAGLI